MVSNTQKLYLKFRKLVFSDLSCYGYDYSSYDYNYSGDMDLDLRNLPVTMDMNLAFNTTELKIKEQAQETFRCD